MPEYEDEKTAEELGAGCGVCAIKPWTKEGLIGSKDYDYSYLCMPTYATHPASVERPMPRVLPCRARRRALLALAAPHVPLPT